MQYKFNQIVYQILLKKRGNNLGDVSKFFIVK